MNKQLYGDDLVLANIWGNNSQYTECTILTYLLHGAESFLIS